MSNGRRLLVVCHGAGRGRPGPFLDQALEFLDATRPALRRSITRHATGDGEASLAGVSTVLFWLADPLRERYPACYAEASLIASRAAEAGIRIANPPDALSNSIKSTQARIWSKAGIPTPGHQRFDTQGQLAEQADALAYPLLVKSDEYHGQRMALFRTARELRRALAPQSLLRFRKTPRLRIRTPLSVAPFVDVRKSYDQHGPDKLWSGYFHKKRSIVLGGLVHPRHVIFSSNPIVSLENSTLGLYRARTEKAGHAVPLDALTRQSIAEDNRCFLSAPDAPDVMRRACRVLGLATAAIDYSVTADGEVVLWEANPYFFLYSPGSYILPQERQLAERNGRLMADVSVFFDDLVSGVSGASADDQPQHVDAR